MKKEFHQSDKIPSLVCNSFKINTNDTDQNAQLNRVNGLYSRRNDPVVVKMSC